ncbi:MAG TPA: DUF4058 family protein [Gemmataceae bacterium]|nr:DUF4058 family protein [Gemmataceae bacterium]
MKSPFPGMDPYIESCGLWGDFHHHLIDKIYDALAAAVPERYVVRTNERSYLVLVGAEGKEDKAFLPDVRVVAPPLQRKEAKEARGTALAEPSSSGVPIPMRPFIEEEFHETFVEVLDADEDNRLVTCIEVLSPSNKAPGTEGWDLYQRKRQGLLLSQSNLVEIDLLRGGCRMPMLDPWPPSPYTLLVARPRLVRRCLVWPATFEAPLPELPVPLLKGDPDIPLNLQVMVDAIYARSRYGRTIDYTRALDPPLSVEQAEWFTRRLADMQAAEPARKPRRRRR